MQNNTTRRLNVLSQHIVPQVSSQYGSLLNHESTSSDGHFMEKESTVLNPGTGKALVDERNKSSFSSRELTYFLDGGKEYTEIKENFMKLIENDPAFQQADRYDAELNEHRVSVFKKIQRFVQIRKLYKTTLPEDKKLAEVVELELYTLLGITDPSFYTRYGIHNGLFRNAIMYQAHQALREKVLPLADSLQIYGCFAMTEMGAGSNVQNLETTATFDIKSQTFTINSPTITSLKWWIGGAGQTSTHAVVFARLLLPTEGKPDEYTDHGVHSFFVQLRSTKDHEALPGIQIGDIGKKQGRDGIDNGYIRFSNVRIPREYMLMQWSEVTPEGKYLPTPLPQLQYAPLVEGRIGIVMSSAYELQRAVTIAIRYACIRRQFKQKGFNEPLKLMDYQTHQYYLLPLLAGAVAIQFTGRKLIHLYQHVILDNLKQKKVLSVELADLHNCSASLKAYASWMTAEGIDTCRQCCGGHGYSAYSGFGQLYNDFIVNCTWEGANTVLVQQTSSYLIKSIQKVIKNNNKPVLQGASIQYLNNYPAILASKCRAQSVEDFFNHQILLEAYQYKACKLVLNAGTRILQEFKIHGKGHFQAFNNCQVDLVRCAKAHSFLYMVETFILVVQDPSNASILPGKTPAPCSPELHKGLKKLCDLFALYHLELDMAVFLTEGYMTSAQAKMCSAAVRQIMLEVRKDAIAYIDAFNMSDFIVNSPLGSFDGNVYQKYFERVRKTSYGNKRAPYYEDLIKQVINPNAGFP